MGTGVGVPFAFAGFFASSAGSWPRGQVGRKRGRRYARGAPAPRLTIAAVRLDELAGVAGSARVVGDESVEISELAYDSRRVRPGTLFFCVPGEKVDGHEFGAAAVEAGATALVVEGELPTLSGPQVLVEDARTAMAPMSARFHQDPTAELKIAGITGTNGKTTTAFLLPGIL